MPDGLQASPCSTYVGDLQRLAAIGHRQQVLVSPSIDLTSLVVIPRPPCVAFDAVVRSTTGKPLIHSITPD